MKKITIYTLLFTTTMTSSICSATNNSTPGSAIENAIENYKRTLPSTPEHIRSLTAENRYDGQSPFSQGVLKAADTATFRRDKHKKLVARRLELESEHSQMRNAEELAHAEDQHRRELEEIIQTTIRMALNEERVGRELEELRGQNGALEERYENLERRKSEIEAELAELSMANANISDSRERNVAVLREALEEVERELNEAIDEKLKSQIKVQKLEIENRKVIKQVENLEEQKRQILSAFTTTNSSSNSRTAPATVPTLREMVVAPLPIAPNISTTASADVEESEFNSDDDLDADLTGGSRRNN